MDTIVSLVPKKSKKLSKMNFKRNMSLLFMTVPFFIIVVIFLYVPLWGWSMAFVNYYPGVSIFKSVFVGLKYFSRLFGGGSEFPIVLRNTLVLSFLGILISPLTVILALMLNEVKNALFKRIVQTLSSFPNFVSWVIVYSLFFSILSVEDGVLNIGLLKFHVLSHPIDFLGTPQISWLLQTFITFWKNVGWGAIIYIAAIAGIDSELYDAAKVDGAGRLAQMWNVTVPGILPTFFVLLVLNIGNLLSAAGGFEQYFVFHNALVHTQIEVLDTYAYRMGMELNDFSLSTAAGIFKTFISVFLLFFANKLHKKVMGHPII